ncbi:hypothetical protein VNI00_001897 [Paramarasmius palmivorus]|uniref:Nucleolar 27S pre-rRNA processing Urb2/Npa2 C-terminal domain-containing protein n=1 Tax=Paramarasmius palmivorus TaxID=297713 RepID=A0AAW0E079_9AGAR
MASQHFIRALKNPQENENKIDIARQAWSNKSLKGEAIADWILSQFKAAIGLFDARYWNLLYDVISSPEPWLGPLFNRISIVPILIAYLKSIPDAETAPIVSKCIQIIWPLSVQKVTVEHLLDCFAALVAFIAKTEPTEDLVVVGMIIASAFKRSLSVSSLKRKIFATFLQEHMSEWLMVVTGDSTSDLHRAVRVAGLETLFNLDVLRDPKSEQMLVDRLHITSPEIAVPALPLIYSAFVQTTRKHRGALFSHDSTEEFRTVALRVFVSLQAIIRKTDNTHAFWSCNTSLLEVVNQENLLGGNNARPQVNATFEEIITCALAELSTNLAPLILRCLSIMVQIDYLIIGPHLSDVLLQLLLIPANEQVLDTPFLKLVIDYHVKTRTVHEYIRSLLAATTSQRLAKTPRSTHELYDTALDSIVFHPSHSDQLSKQVHAFLTLPQILETARYLTGFIRDLWETYRNSLRSERHEKKRQKLDGNESQPVSPDISAVHVALSGRIAVVVLSSLSTDALPQSSKQELALSLDEFSSATLSTMVSKTIKVVQNEGAWPSEIILATVLQLEYALALQKGLVGINNSQPSEKMIELLQAQNVQLLPELRLELIRNLLRQSLKSTSFNFDDVLSPVLRAIASESQGLESITILHMVTQRWLACIDARASDAQLEEFVSFLLTKGPRTSTPVGIIVAQCFASAEFWELPNIRRIFLAVVEKSTSVVLSSDKVQDIDTQKHLLSMFESLLVVPGDYFTRSLKIDLIGRVASFDTLLGSLRHTVAYDVDRALRVVRVLRNRLLSNLGPHEAPDIVNALEHLTVCAPASDELMGSTLDLAEIYMVIPEPVHIQMQKLFSVVKDALFPALASLGNEPSPDVLKDLSTPFYGRTLCKSLAMHSTLFDSPKVLQEASVAVLGVAIEESHWCHNEDLMEHIGLLVATYIILHARCRATLSVLDAEATLGELENGLSSVFRSLNIDAFQHALNLVSSALVEGSHGALDIIAHLAAVLTHDPPQNTLQLTQTFTTTCINAFNGHAEYSRGSQQVQLNALRFIAQRSRDRPAALRLVDITGIWSFLAKILRPHTDSTPETNIEILGAITSIATSLIRLRRDLVTLTLPHLVAVLRLLIMSVRSPRPNLGAKQTGIVSDSLPTWINVRQPLGPEEAKSVARLLESLTTKTLVKVHGSSMENQKAESLAKPFSKHAAYVVKAYIEAVNDPLCILPSAVKKALQPGLYSLCGMISEYNRDALMVSLHDSADKAVFKDLWKEYEKQRYVGKG